MTNPEGTFGGPVSLDFAGDLLFVGYEYGTTDTTAVTAGQVLVINAHTGATVETMQRASTMEPKGGKLDDDFAISAYQRPTEGDYILLEEEDAQGKIVEFDLQHGDSTTSLSSSTTSSAGESSRLWMTYLRNRPASCARTTHPEPAVTAGGALPVNTV